MTHSNPPVTVERLGAALADEQDTIRRLRQVLETVWRYDKDVIEDAVGECGYALAQVLPLVADPHGGAA